MSADALVKAVSALVTGVTFHPDTVPSTTTYPYVLGTSNFPRVSARSQARSVHALQLRLRTTVVGLSGASVRIIGQKVSDALEHATVYLPGYVLGRVESVPNDQQILEDFDVTINGQHPQYVVLDWAVTVSKTA